MTTTPITATPAAPATPVTPETTSETMEQIRADEQCRAEIQDEAQDQMRREARRPGERARDLGDPYRYGVYLRPDPRTCLAVTTITAQLRAQYGFVSAGAFPPHATLVGSQHLGRDEDAILAALDAALVGRSAFEVHNRGVRSSGVGFIYDVHHRTDGSLNAEFVDLAAAVDAAVEPLRLPMNSPQAHLFERAAFLAHLSLASHDLYERPDLHDEVGDFITGLDIAVPQDFRADTVTLYRTSSSDWSGRWWRTLECEHVKTWTLG